MEDVTEEFRKKVEFGGKDNIIFRPGCGNALSRVASSIKTTDYIRTCYENVN